MGLVGETLTSRLKIIILRALLLYEGFSKSCSATFGQVDMYPCPIRMRAQSFQNFVREGILKFQDQISQNDRCKNLDQRHLRYARGFKSTNHRIATIGSSKPQPCPTQGCCNFRSLKRKSLVTNQLSCAEFSRV